MRGCLPNSYTLYSNLSEISIGNRKFLSFFYNYKSEKPKTLKICRFTRSAKLNPHTESLPTQRSIFEAVRQEAFLLGEKAFSFGKSGTQCRERSPSAFEAERQKVFPLGGKAFSFGESGTAVPREVSTRRSKRVEKRESLPTQRSIFEAVRQEAFPLDGKNLSSDLNWEEGGT